MAQVFRTIAIGLGRSHRYLEKYLGTVVKLEDPERIEGWDKIYFSFDSNPVDDLVLGN